MLEIIYRNAYCIAVNKPAGMLVHRSWLDSRETQFVMQTLRDQIGRRVYPVHRLDRPTSGVLLFALDSKSAHALAQQFAAQTVQKTYWAVVRGYLNGAGRIDYPLKEEADKIADPFADPDKPAQPAVTDYRCLAQTEQPFQSAARYPTSRYSWAELTPHTGRKHQLRRHMKHIFHPIVGDTTHGDTAQNRAVAAHTGTTRLMLHARSLTFRCLENHSAIRLIAEADGQWQRLAEAFGWQLEAV
ncbi:MULTISPECIES: tRNA pseudouridine(65) synthase TruC [unclassified Neisseria]|uniref:tRNA pseudouridine(65) synthase TruC n=1 Tax=unclassified Neisseria TaxID=2623750 RepID=UPI002665EC44|nr:MULTISPECIES: tRNA pseudouridine(65) synthase TruC [unclassified Neisseria]MDO1509670.1 tRNA pseudouridine(65) synthase TruC [Neisseria sp. MVDL19-042950]MDO1516006.1 tRNA pseudouridine(65) synthase TruC [Neisseria sp. MVDL18-041461]MDO1563119.1 tRNA pseudouridine(65) synthase TruC [Neisseria sp. MVDL20-010259]